GMVLRDQCRVLWRDYCRAACHAVASRAATRTRRLGWVFSARLYRRLQRALRISGRALSAADGGGHRSLRYALRAAHAVGGGAFLRRPVLYRGGADERGRGGCARRRRLSLAAAHLWP